MDKLSKAQELEREAQRLRMEVHEEKRQAEFRKEDEFKKLNKMDVYTSDDYCGLKAGKYEFYYGYEVTVCPKHDLECPEEYDCDLAEWAFQAEVDGKTVMTMPKSKLHPEENEVPFWYLVAGIGHFLRSL